MVPDKTMPITFSWLLSGFDDQHFGAMKRLSADRQSRFMAKLTGLDIFVFLEITSRHVDLQSLTGLNATSCVLPF